MGEDPSADRKREPNLELPQLRLPGFRSRKVRRSAPAEEPTEQTDQPTEPQLSAPAHRDRRIHRPALPGPVAAVLAGLVVGAVGAGMTYGGLRGCDAVNGAPSCGAPGLGFLVAIAIGMVAIGALVLKAFGTEQPLGTSLLGVGIVVVIVLAGLTGVIFSPWMFVAIPLLAAAAYALAHWVTTRLVEPAEAPPGPDVR